MDNKNKVMIVDDDKINLSYLNHLLGDDYTIYSIRDPKEVTTRAVEYLPDLILLDIVMPEMSGYEVLAELKSSEETRSIPVIFMTGLNDSGNELKGLELGAEDYITKPFTDGIVKIRVEKQIKIINQMRTIEYLSMIDQLTGIANRRSFDQHFYKVWWMAVRSKSLVSLMMIDVDSFKIYNDTYGHQQGDTALQVVAGILKRTILRATDFVARWGGEEFAVLLPMTDSAGAMIVAESIRSNAEKEIIYTQDGIATSITVSIGLNTVTPTTDDSMERFISDADNALYTAKKEGRNRVCIV